MLGFDSPFFSSFDDSHPSPNFSIANVCNSIDYTSLDSFIDSMSLDVEDELHIHLGEMLPDDHCFALDEMELIPEELQSLREEDIHCITRWLLESDDRESCPFPQLNSQEDDEDSSQTRSTICNSTLSTDTILNVPQIVNFPAQLMEMDNQLMSLHHLYIAYGEAVELGHMELAQVIAGRLSEKISLVGDSTERVLCYLFESSSKDMDYLVQESSQNFNVAFELFNLILPYGKFAHFTANSLILEAVPRNFGTALHIFDFDIGEGLQWSSLIVTLGQMRLLGQESVKLTSIKWALREDGSSRTAGFSWRFEETKSRLEDHARENGINLEVNEVELEDLKREVKTSTSRRSEWLAFNCMVALPHMGRRRRRSHAIEFLRIAKESLANTYSTECTDSIIKNGIITFGDGDAWRRKPDTVSGFKLHLENCIEHYRALLDTVETSISRHLGVARVAMESLFVSPLLSIDSLRDEFKEIEEGWVELGTEGWKVSSKNLMEAKELVREGESMYRVRVDEENMLTLEWRETALLRISSWR